MSATWTYYDRIRTDWLVRHWLEILGAKCEPPPYSPERKDAWRSGYADALHDVAELKVSGRMS